VKKRAMDLRLCKKCNISKLSSNFSVRKPRQCKECKNKYEGERNRKRTKERSLSYLSSRLKRAATHRTKLRKRGKVTVTLKWILQQLKLGYCQGSYPPIPLVLDKPGSPFSPSLDRIDSSNYDYTPSNVRVVCKAINISRSDMGDKDILKISESLSGFIRKRRNSI